MLTTNGQFVFSLIDRVVWATQCNAITQRERCHGCSGPDADLAWQKVQSHDLHLIPAESVGMVKQEHGKAALPCFS